MTNENQFLKLALFYASKGWAVFPLQPKEKDKFLLKSWKEEASKDPEQIKAWWSKWPTANVGLVTGIVSGIVAMDIDPRHGGEESLLALEAERGKLPHTVEALTGGGGRHKLFKYTQADITTGANNPLQGLDFRGTGGYIVAPPSVHPSGGRYQWEVSSLPTQVELATLPEWLAESYRKHTPGKTDYKPTEPTGPRITEGGRNATLASLAGSMRRRGMDLESILAALKVENVQKCSPPLSDVEVERIAKSVARYDPTAVPVFRNEQDKIEPHEPLNAWEAGFAFLELLDNLEGRSIRTGIAPLDDATGGLERQTLTILAARPSMGKSTLAWQIARNVASQRMKAIFFSLEVSIPSMWAKAACGVCGLRWKDIRSGEARQDDLDRLVEATASLMQRYDEYLLIDDRVSTSKTIWAAVEKHKPDLVVVDHLRLVADNGDNENNRLGEISQRLKDMAKTFNCQVLCLAQLNRNVENREDKRPILADLRESGKIEENADQILMLYRDDYYDQTEGKFKKTQPTELLIRKFRDDIMNNRITLTFDAQHQWFESYGK